jgi:hypothetical protein
MYAMELTLLGNVQALELSVPVSLVMARQSMPKALSSLPSAQRSYTSELSRYPEFSSERVQSSEFGELQSCSGWYPGELELSGVSW